jgi:hypothetical protein
VSELTEFYHEPPAAFRGSRDYVHSTDIYEEMVSGANLANLRPSGRIDLHIRRKILSRPIYQFTREAFAGEDPAYARIELSGSEWLVRVISTEHPVEASKTYDEQRIFDASFIEGNSISLRQNIGMRPIEVATALSVKLHKTLFAPGPRQRWLLGRFNVSRPLGERDAEFMTIEIERRIGKNITRARMIAEDGAIGSLTFMLG